MIILSVKEIEDLFEIFNKNENKKEIEEFHQIFEKKENNNENENEGNNMKFLFYVFNEKKIFNKEDLEKEISKFKEEFDPNETNMIVKPHYEYYKIYEFDDGISADEIYQYTGADLDENKKYVFIPVKEYFDINEKLKEKFLGYKILEYLDEFGKEVKTYNVYDGFVFKIECDDKVILIGDDFGIQKGKCLTKEEFEKILNS